MGVGTREPGDVGRGQVGGRLEGSRTGGGQGAKTQAQMLDLRERTGAGCYETRESLGLHSSHCRAKETSSRPVSGT